MGEVRKIGKKWYIDYRDANGNRIRKVAGTTKRQAERILAELEAKKYYEKRGIPVLDKISTEELFNQFQSMKEKRVRSRTMAKWYGRLRFWKNKHLKKSDIFSPLTPQEIEQILDELFQDKSPSTVNGYLDVLKQLYRYAIDINLIRESPAERIKRFREKSRKPPRFFTKKEIKMIIENSNDFYKSLFQFFLYTGMRRDEVRFLEWSDIDFKRKIIRVQNKDKFSTKTEKGRNIPMHPIVEKILRKRKQDSGFVFSSPEGGVYSVNVWVIYIKRKAKKLNIENATIHNFRHTFASWLVMEGIDLPTIAQLLGHSDIKTTMIYSHLAPDHVKKAVERLPKIGG